MAQPFSFGFSGDDIEEDPNDAQLSNDSNTGARGEVPAPIEARRHTLDELLTTLPSKLSYSLLRLTSPKGHTAVLPRRELFDVRLQLMAEDDLDTSATSTSTNPALSALSSSDLQPNVYEGGYKTWECSLDLVKFLLDRGPRRDLDDMYRVQHVVEMGCGTALPSLLLFQYALKNRLRMDFTLMDYNYDVLRLVTLPNLLLTWVSTLPVQGTVELFGESAQNPIALAIQEQEQQQQQETSNNPKEHDFAADDLDLTPALLTTFRASLLSLGIKLSFISGSWSPTAKLLSLVPSAQDTTTLILGSETIYSPGSLSAFTEAVAALIKRVREGKALVAAKRVYFGVGGSVDGFKEECARQGCVGVEVEFEGLEGAGVKRCLVEVERL
ncbi:uncharacterized protein EI97DRAFT_375727 [Westerdykella ornata]|uniref:protein-histidine N-methyltransferase n=1 Tax=Westerdykella ornata TaxID=318751 RepID=A0A6A6JLW3_WESOR|nr:uncharacterized protein EI97DRAFT_375727 [Westerdykella ornata]KAF2276938.1 hypothetical protein EI97DRAFT_375727 [Westerdykella ornata]